MEKDFDHWNLEKKIIQERQDVLLYREREIRWCQLGLNVGFEQDGTGVRYARPVLILKAFSRQVCLVIPLTTSLKKNRYYVRIGSIGGREASAIVSQLRLIDTRRFDQKIGVLDSKVFSQVKTAVKAML